MVVQKEIKETLCNDFFDNQVKPKHLKDFEVTTPNKNVISGVICKKSNHFLGSMVITHVKTKTNEFDTIQFVQAMPKIHYYDYNNELYQDKNYVEYNCYEKLDGTCLIIYPLFDNLNNLIEIIPKTRGTPVADKFILSMMRKIDKKNIKLFYQQNPNCVLIFELYGTLNQHSIEYPRYYVDIKLLGVVENNKFLLDSKVNQIASVYSFKRPDILFRIFYYNNFWRIILISEKPIKFYHNFDENNERFPTQYDMIIGLKDRLTRLNNKFHEENDRVYTEGVVIYGKNAAKEQLFLKVKPYDIEEKCKTENGIPRKFIVKELNKYFDEYGSQAKHIYQENQNHYLDYVVNGLSEEFSDDAVMNTKTIKRIERVFFDMLEAKEPPVGIQEICHKLISEYPKSDISDLMRVFAREYPEKKKDSRLVYSVLEKMV